MSSVVLVNEQDQTVGLFPKVDAHLGEGRLHRAFSAFIFNDKGELLLQRRSKKKMLWPLYWSNSCCSHPLPDEGYVQAGERRLNEELGFSCPLTYQYKFVYHAQYKDVGSEYELCAVLVGRSNEEPVLDPDEVAEFRWVSVRDILKEIETHPEQFTPWFKMEVVELEKSFFIQ